MSILCPEKNLIHLKLLKICNYFSLNYGFDFLSLFFALFEGLVGIKVVRFTKNMSLFTKNYNFEKIKIFFEKMKIPFLIFNKQKIFYQDFKLTTKRTAFSN